MLQVEYCRLANLPDLDQSNDFVRTTLGQWVQNTVKKYGFDGIRIDTVPEVSINSTHVRIDIVQVVNTVHLN